MAPNGSTNVPDPGQIRYWNTAITAPWVALQERLDNFFEPLSAAGLRQASVASGEHVVDVGCGCGATVIDLARAVGRSGHVQGIDISEQMLGRARERVAVEGLKQVTLTLADAATFGFPANRVDLIFSRLGIMFFADPISAFGNLRHALKPSGRLVFVCCRTLAENRYIAAAVLAARAVLPPGTIPVTRPEDPGMFSLADPARVTNILQTAGFGAVTLTPLDVTMRLADGNNPADAAVFSSQFGPLPRILEMAGSDKTATVLAAVTEAYRPIAAEDGVNLQGAFWIVAARP